MNRNLYRVIFSAARGLWVAVQETAVGLGKGRSTGTPGSVVRVRPAMLDMLLMREVAFAALCVLGMQPVLVEAQVIPSAAGSGSKPVAGATASGMPVVQIATPNGGGVSNNNYTSFNVGTQGLILNNSAGNVLTQQAGYVIGNPNLVPGNSAKVIVNQVVGGSASQLLGYMEVAGPAADVVVANPSGIYCNGCGFINTNRGVLTTGTPVFGGSGSLDAFHVTGGQIQIGASGLNAGNIDQVDLIARSVQVNGQIWANKALNVVAGTNDVQYSNLATTALTPDANHPVVAIDVAQLGGMYAGKISLVGTEAGVGVNSTGAIAAQAGDVSINSQGQVTLAGTMSASGNVSVNSATGINNTGSVYATQNAALTSQGQVGNSGTVAALGNTSINAASVNSTGALGAGIDSSGNVTGTGSLSVLAPGAVSATGTNLAGGNLSLSGSSLNLAGAQSLANGNAALTASSGDITQTGGSLGAAGALNVSASGAFANDHGQISAALLGITAGSLSNQSGVLAQTGAGTTSIAAAGALNNTGGEILTNGQNATIQSGSLTNATGTISHAGTGTLSVQSGTLDNTQGSIGTNGQAVLSASSLSNASGTLASAQAMSLTAGALDNTAGTINAGGALNATASTVQNTAGRIVSQGTDGLTLSATGQITNAAGTTAQGTAGGVIGGNGDAAVQAATLANSGMVTAAQTLGVTTSGALNNNGGTLTAATLDANAASLTNAQGTISANTVTVTAPQLDNTSGKIAANQLALNATTLTNEHGTITQLGGASMGLNVSGTLDNSNGGTIQTNSTNLTLAPATLDNNGGTIVHAGTGTLTVDPGQGLGAVTNVGGSLVSNGQVALSAASVDNTSGTISGATGLSATTASALNNTSGQLVSGGDLSATTGTTLTNTGGTISATDNTTVQAATFTNGGSVTAGQNLGATATGTLNNDNGTLSAQSVTANAASLTNAGGKVSGNTVSLMVPQLDNSSGQILANQLAIAATNLTNEGGTISQFGSVPISVAVSQALDNSNSGLIQTNSSDFTLDPAALNNNGGTIVHAGTGVLTVEPGSGARTLTNVGGKIVTNGSAAVTAGSLDNAGGMVAAQGTLSVTTLGALTDTNGKLASGADMTLSVGGALANAGGQVGAGQSGGASGLTVNAASIDDMSGLIANGGTGSTTLNGGSQITNTGGHITGNGAVRLSATAISNTQSAQLSGASLQINSSTLDNTSGQIGSVGNTVGDIGITTGTLTDTSGQIGSSRNLTVTANTLAGGGSYSAVNDLGLNLQGDFTTAPNYSFAAGHNLTFTLPGTFSNAGTLTAVNNLGVNAADISNSGTLAAGGLLSTQSNMLTNTGTIVGSSVTLSATQSILNQGPSALIGATDSAGTLALLAPTITNIDNSTSTDTAPTTAIYGLGAVVLAGGVDANGNFTNANQITNSSGLIESGGNMTLAANQVTNTRTTMQTSSTTNVDPNLLASLGISLSGCTAIHMAACSGQFVAWTPANDPALKSLIGGVFTIPPNGGQWNSGYQYTTYTGVPTAIAVSAISPQGQIVSGGSINASSTGNFQNYWSAVTAAGNTASPVKLDQNSWQGQTAPQVTVTYSGQYHYTNYDHSIGDWELPFGNAPFVGPNPGGYSVAPADIRTYALPSYESTFTSNGTISGTGVTINNVAGNAGVTPLGLLPGQSITGTGAGSVSGSIGAGGASKPVDVAVRSGGVANSGLANSNNPVIASATAVNVLNNIAVPHGGLFSTDTAPNAPYLIQTNPAFTNQQNFLSSNYYFQQLGMNPSQIHMRLGDGFYEQQLVQQQILALTGKSVLTDYASTQTEYEALMTSGAQLAKALNLAPGTGLSAAQVAQLTGNVVIMQSQVVNGQSVLVPVVYLAKANQQNMGNGPVIAATNIDLENAQSVTNSGTISASNNLTLAAQTIDSTNGTLQAGNQMALVSAGNVNLTSATVNAGSLALQAGGNLILDTAAKTVYQVAPGGATRTTTTLGPVASINVANNAQIVTGGNFEQNAGNLNVGGALAANIGGNWTLGAQQTSQSISGAGANGVYEAHVATTTGSSVNVGGASQIGVGGDLTATGANINLGGGGTVAANGNVNLQAATATSSTTSNTSGSDGHGSYTQAQHFSDDAVTGTTLTSGSDLTIAAGKDINVTGSTVNLTQGTATLAAQGNVNVGATTETHVADVQSSGSHSGFLSSTSKASTSNTTATYADGSTISADAVNIQAGKDINVAGSTVVGTNDVNLAATNNVNIATTQDTMQSSSSYQEHHSGLGTSGLSLTIGSSSQAQTNQQSSVTNNASEVGSLNGNLNVQAGQTLHVTGSDLVAGQNVTGTAQNVIIDSATNTSNTSSSQQSSSSGLSIGLSGSIGNAINTAVSDAEAASQSQNGRATALYAIAAAGSVGNGAAGQILSPSGSKPDIGVQVSIGSSHSSSSQSENQTTQSGSSVTAGGAATFVATGTQPNSGNITVAGSTINANDVVLNAANQVNLINTTNTDSTRSTNQSSSSSVGVSYSLGSGFGISASMSNAHGNGNSDAVTQNATNVQGAHSVTVTSGGDTTIQGSKVSGDQVTANVGGNLKIQSVQDTTVSVASQSSSGGGFTISQGGGSASYSDQTGKANGNYAGVNEQAGIQAGTGGFNVNVKGNTNLTGGYIAGTAPSDKNTLTTGTLTTSDIQNSSNYSASSSGFTVGGAGLGIAPMISQSASGNSNAVTKSAIGAGTITITDPANQTQSVVSINRDTSNTNGTVSQLPDVQNILSNQADVMSAANAAAAQVAQGIGTYASVKQQQAEDAAKAGVLLGDAAATTQANNDASSWSEGGLNRALLQATGGALIGGLGGGGLGSAASGAAGAFVSSKLAGSLGQIAYEAGPAGSLSNAVANAVANVVATAAGGLVGGGTGAFMASNVDMYNRQLHPDEKQRIRDLAHGDPAEEAKLSAAACALVHCSAEYADGSASYNYYSQLEALGNSPDLASERNTLSHQQGLFTYTVNSYNPISDANIDAAKKFNNTYQVTTRGLGALQAVGGAATVISGAGSVAGGAATCLETLGAGCAAAASGTAMIGWGADQTLAGIRTLGSGQQQSTLGALTLQGAFGISPEASELLYGMAGFVPTAVNAVLANNVVNAEAAANAWARGTYTGSSTAQYSGNVYRYTLPEYSSGTWEIYPGNVAANHRYSPPGVGAVYAGTSPQTAAAEVSSYGPLDGRVLVANNIVVNNVLDLTNPAARQALGVTLEQLTNTAHGGSSYNTSQALSAWARDQGYQAILAPSAQSPSGANLISFKSLSGAGK